MKDFIEGGNWWNEVDAGVFSCTMERAIKRREIIPFYGFDLEGLPERWVKILKGETNWIPKIVFKLKK